MKIVTTRHHHIRGEFVGKDIRILDPIHVDFAVWKFTVPAGFQTDGASIPKLMRVVGFEPYEEDTLRGAVVHDYIYRVLRYIPRFWADIIFLYLMRESQAGYFKRSLYFLGVRLFGWWPRNVVPFLKSVVTSLCR